MTYAIIISFYSGAERCKFPIFNFSFPIFNFPFPIPHSPFPIPHSPFPIPHSPFPIPHSPFPIPHSPFPIPHSPFPIPHSPFPIPHSPFPIPHSPFPIPHSPFPVLVTSSSKLIIQKREKNCNTFTVSFLDTGITAEFKNRSAEKSIMQNLKRHYRLGFDLTCQLINQNHVLMITSLCYWNVCCIWLKLTGRNWNIIVCRKYILLSSMNSSFHLSSNKYSQNDILHSLFGEQYVFRVKGIKCIDKFFTSRHLELR